MANWEYKVISSGKHGMATMAALEQHLNDLGQQQWEIINWHTAPDNPLLFTGLARRPILRDWKPDEMPAAQEAARAEKAAEEVAKERDAWRETIKEELEFIADKDEDEGDPEADREELLDLLRAQMKRSQRGPGFVGSLSFLARRLEQDDNDLLGALAEIGLPLAEDPQATPVSVEHEDEFFWLNKNARGEIWLNCGPKAPAAKPPARQPEPRAERPVASRHRAELRDEGVHEGESAETAPVESPEAPAAGAPVEDVRERREPEVERAPRREREREQPQRQPQPPREPGQGRQPEPREAAPLLEGEPLLAKLRPMMRRNRRGRGWSGSTSYLSRALRHQESELMEAFAKLGLRLTEDPQAKPVFLELNGFLYWLNRGQGGQIWINAREQRAGEAHTTDDEGPESGEFAPHAPGATVAASTAAEPVAPEPSLSAPVVESVPVAESAPGAAVASETQPVVEANGPDAVPENSVPETGDDSIFARIRPHFVKNKRSAALSAAPGVLAEALGVAQADLVDALVKAGLSVPESEEAKPVFAEHAGEIFWFNRNAKDELWLNAKAKPARKTGASRSASRPAGAVRTSSRRPRKTAE